MGKWQKLDQDMASAISKSAPVSMPDAVAQAAASFSQQLSEPAALTDAPAAHPAAISKSSPPTAISKSTPPAPGDALAASTAKAPSLAAALPKTASQAPLPDVEGS